MAVGANLLETGSVIGGYRIDGLISRGGMGLVYRATNVALDRIYALKVLAPELAEDAKFQQRFRREMRLAASLHHPNVVGIHYAGEQDGMLFFVMDLITGTDLHQVLVDGPLEPSRTIELLRQVASALDAAHAVGLVHRDVKPANILIARRDGEEHAYLTDFGLAKRPDTASGLTATGLVVGTVDYIAPEQISGDQVDARSDIYALGCVFFHMLTGQVPYRRPNTFATMLAHLNEPPPVLHGPISESHPGFAAIIATAMSKDPSGRYSSAGDFARDAAAALRGGRYMGPPSIVATGEASPAGHGHEVAAPAAPREVPLAAASTIKRQRPPAARAARAEETTAQMPTPDATEIQERPPPPGKPPETRRRPWYERGPVVAAIAAALAVGVVLALLAGHVIGGGGQSSQSSTSSAGRGTSATTTRTLTSTATATATATATVPASPSPQGALAAVGDYWNDIQNGDFGGAYGLLAPGTLPQTKSQFIADHQQENITNVQFQGRATSSGGSTATVGIVNLQTTDQQNGCRKWSGDYQLSYTGGKWLIDQANLQPQPCS
jgi:serine/threonine-protein kinase